MKNPLLELLSKLRREFTTQLNRPYFETLENALKAVSDAVKTSSGDTPSSVNLALGVITFANQVRRAGVTFDCDGGGLSFDNDFWTFDS